MCLPSGTVTAKTEANTIELVQYLMKKYNIPIDRVVRHYDASRKNCPAQFNLDKKWTRWFAFKAKLAGTSTNANSSTSTKSKFKVGDKVKVKALYVSSTGGGKSTKSAGKIGVIKRDEGKGKRFLVENWGWAHENDIELVADNTYTAKKVGDTVTVQNFATHYQTGQKISPWVKGSKHKIKQVKPVNQSKSKRAYLLEGINSWVLEQDVK
jgi:N-acetylmuramoyl-L-alanine amidase CwlA